MHYSEVDDRFRPLLFYPFPSFSCFYLKRPIIKSFNKTLHCTAEDSERLELKTTNRRRQGRHSPHSYIYRLRLKGFGQKLTSNTELTRSHNVKNLSQHTALNIYMRQSRLLLAISGSILLRKTAIPPVVIPHRKTVVPSKANPLFSSVLAISGSILLRKTVIPSVAIPHRKTIVPSKANPPFASALAISGSIMLRKTAIPSEAVPHRKAVVRSNANPLFASVNPDLARIKRKIIRRGESE